MSSMAHTELSELWAYTEDALGLSGREARYSIAARQRICDAINARAKESK